MPCSHRVSTPAVCMAMLGVWGGTLAAGCSPKRGDDSAPAPVGGFEAPGGSDSDPERAFLPLEAIKPVPPVPSSAATEPPALSARLSELLGQVRELEARRHYTEASLRLERALRDDPSAVAIHSALARVYWGSGARGRARLHAHKALEVRGDDGGAHYVIGRLALADGDREEAIQRFRIALQCPDVASDPQRRAVAHYRLALSLEGEGYLTAALAEYRAYDLVVQSFGDTGPRDPELAKLMQVEGGAAAAIASLCEKLGRYGEAAEALEQLVAAGAADAAGRGKLARMLARAGRVDRALHEARAIEGDSELTVAVLKDIHAVADRPDGIVEELRELCQRRPDDFVFVRALAGQLVGRDRAQEAEQTLRGYAKTHPEAPAGAWALFDFLSRRSRWRDAVTVVAGLLRQRGDQFAAGEAKMSDLARDRRAVTSLLGPDGAAVAAPADAERAYLLGCLAMHAGRTEAAEHLWRRSMELSSRFVGPRLALAGFYCERYRWRDAIEVAQVAGESVQPDPRLERLLGQAWAGLDRFDEAVAHYNAAIRLNRSDTRAMVALGRLLERVDRRARARRQYEAVLKEDPLNATARERLLMLSLEAGERDAAVDQVVELRRLAAPPTVIARCVARLALVPRAPDYDRFRRTLLDAIREEGRPDPETLFLVAYSLYAERDYAAAGTYVAQALSIDPDHEPSLELQILLHREGLEFEEAERLLRVLTDRYPNRALWRDHLADILEIEQKHDEVAALLRSALKSEALSTATVTEQPASEAVQRRGYRIQLLDALQAGGRHDEAIEAIRQWRRDAPEDSDLWASLVDAYLQAGRSAEAQAAAQAWYEQTDAPEAKGALVAVYTRGNEHDRACQVLLDWLEDDPDNDELIRNLIAALTTAKRFDDALELLDNKLLDSDDPAAYQRLAVAVYDAARRHDDAIRVIGRWIQREERRWQGRVPADTRRLQSQLLAEELIRAGRFDEARGRLTGWIDDARDPAAKTEFLLLLSECERRRGRSDLSLEALELAYELNPLDANVCNSLGYTWADAGVNLDQAKRLIRYAVARAPRSAAYLDSLGWVLYKAGDFAGAGRWLTLAVGARRPGDPVIHDHLGDALWHLGEGEQAVTHWQTAVALARETLEDREDPGWQLVLELTPAKIDAAGRNEAPQTAPRGESPADAPDGNSVPSDGPRRDSRPGERK